MKSNNFNDVDRYKHWCDALMKYYFFVDGADFNDSGGYAFLYIDKEILNEIGKKYLELGESQGYDNFTEVVLRKFNSKQSIIRQFKEHPAISTILKNKNPPKNYLPLLLFTILPYTVDNESLEENDYYSNINKLVKASSGKVVSNDFNHVEIGKFWEYLEEWSIKERKNEGKVKVFKLLKISKHKFVGYPKSQALISFKQRYRLYDFFYKTKLRPDSELSADDWLEFFDDIDKPVIFKKIIDLLKHKKPEYKELAVHVLNAVRESWGLLGLDYQQTQEPAKEKENEKTVVHEEKRRLTPCLAVLGKSKLGVRFKSNYDFVGNESFNGTPVEDECDKYSNFIAFTEKHHYEQPEIKNFEIKGIKKKNSPLMDDTKVYLLEDAERYGLTGLIEAELVSSGFNDYHILVFGDVVAELEAIQHLFGGTPKLIKGEGFEAKCFPLKEELSDEDIDLISKLTGLRKHQSESTGFDWVGGLKIIKGPSSIPTYLKGALPRVSYQGKMDSIRAVNLDNNSSWSLERIKAKSIWQFQKAADMPAGKYELKIGDHKKSFILEASLWSEEDAIKTQAGDCWDIDGLVIKKVKETDCERIKGEQSDFIKLDKFYELNTETKSAVSAPLTLLDWLYAQKTFDKRKLKDAIRYFLMLNKTASAENEDDEKLNKDIKFLLRFLVQAGYISYEQGSETKYKANLPALTLVPTQSGLKFMLAGAVPNDLVNSLKTCLNNNNSYRESFVLLYEDLQAHDCLPDILPKVTYLCALKPYVEVKDIVIQLASELKIHLLLFNHNNGITKPDLLPLPLALKHSLSPIPDSYKLKEELGTPLLEYQALKLVTGFNVQRFCYGCLDFIDCEFKEVPQPLTFLRCQQASYEYHFVLCHEGKAWKLSREDGRLIICKHKLVKDMYEYHKITKELHIPVSLLPNKDFCKALILCDLAGYKEKIKPIQVNEICPICKSKSKKQRLYAIFTNLPDVFSFNFIKDKLYKEILKVN